MRQGPPGKALIWLLLYSLFVVHLSLYPWHFEASAWLPWTALFPSTRGEWMDSVANIVLYLPLGLIAFRCFGSVALAALAGAFLSGSMEFLQMFTPNRDSSLRDLFCNTLGAAAGAATIVWAQPFLDRKKEHSEAWRLPPTEAMFFLCWTLWFAFPLIPVLRTSVLQGLRTAIAQPGLPSVAGAFDLIMAAWVLGLVLRQRPQWHLAALSLLLLQGFFLNQTFSVWRVLFAILGTLLARWIPTPKTLLAGLLCLWLLVRELYPFQLHPVPVPFSWIPFGGLLHHAADSSYRTLFGKMFLHLSVVWGLWRAGTPRGLTLAIPVLLSLACEVVQRYLPGRTPEITEPCLSALAFLLLTVSVQQQQQASTDRMIKSGSFMPISQ